MIESFKGNSLKKEGTQSIFADQFLRYSFSCPKISVKDLFPSVVVDRGQMPDTCPAALSLLLLNGTGGESKMKNLVG